MWGTPQEMTICQFRGCPTALSSVEAKIQVRWLGPELAGEVEGGRCSQHIPR